MTPLTAKQRQDRNTTRRVYFTGTQNKSPWRERLAELLTVSYYDPNVEPLVVDHLHARRNCEYILYVITPAMTAWAPIAELIDDANKRPSRTLLCVLEHDLVGVHHYSFSREQRQSMAIIERLARFNDVKTFNNLETLACFLNHGTLHQPSEE